jgi:hypothetical protein
MDLRVPRRVGALLAGVMGAARAASDQWLSQGACLERAAEHFIDTWKDALAERNTPQKRAMARDGGLCQVPGCSRAADDEHHVWFRSRGGPDHEANFASTCKPHHLRGIHGGYIRVTGCAPDGLRWEVTGGKPLLVETPTAGSMSRAGSVEL